MNESVFKKESGVLSPDYTREEVIKIVKSLPESERNNPLSIAAAFRDRIEKRASKLMHSEELLENIENISPDDNVIKQVHTLFHKFVTINFSKEELEDLVRDPRFTDSELDPDLRLNDLCLVNIADDRVDIHLNAIASRGAEEVRRLFFEAMSELATRLAKHEKYKNVQIVGAKSWLVGRHPKILQRLGFTLHEDEPGLATISRDDFIKKFSYETF